MRTLPGCNTSQTGYICTVTICVCGKIHSHTFGLITMWVTWLMYCKWPGYFPSLLCFPLIALTSMSNCDWMPLLFKLHLAIFFILAVNQMTNVKGVTRSDKLTKNYYQFCNSTELFSLYSLSGFIKHFFYISFRVLSSTCFHLQQALMMHALISANNVHYLVCTKQETKQQLAGGDNGTAHA